MYATIKVVHVVELFIYIILGEKPEKPVDISKKRNNISGFGS